MNFVFRILILFGIWCLLFDISAQADLVGSSNDPLEISIGSRAMAMGGAYSGVWDGAGLIFNNPAAMARQDSLKMSSMATSLLGDVNYVVAGANAPIKLGLLDGNIGLGYVGSGVDQIISPSATGLSYFDYHHNVLMLAYAANIYLPAYEYDLDAGIRLKYIDKGFGGSQSHAGSGLELDLGLLLPVREETFLGIVLQNALPASAGGRINWPDDDYEGVPMTARIGFATRFFRDDALLAYDYEMRWDHSLPERHHLGLEWALNPLLRLRAGLDQSLDAGTVSGDPTFGVGLRLRDLIFDYAYHPYFSSPDNATHYFSLSYSLSRQAEMKQKNYLKISGLQDRSIVYSGRVRVRGMVLEDELEDVLINDSKVIIDYECCFIYDLPLSVGKNSVKIDLLDDYGKRLKTVVFRVLRLATFKDLDKDYWALKPVENMATLRIITGYPDGTFRPHGEINRAEMVALLGKLEGWEKEEDPWIRFADVSDFHWAIRPISVAADKGIVSGYPDGTFRPFNSITRAEGVATIAKFAKLPPAPEVVLPFKDVPDRHWASSAIKAAWKAGLLDHLADSATFDPHLPLSRGEVAALLSRVEMVRQKVDALYDFEEGYSTEGVYPRSAGTTLEVNIVEDAELELPELPVQTVSPEAGQQYEEYEVVPALSPELEQYYATLEAGPAAPAKKTRTVYHYLSKGETLRSIALEYFDDETMEDRIADWNDIRTERDFHRKKYLKIVLEE